MDGGRRGEWIWCPSSIEGKADGHFFEKRVEDPSNFAAWEQLCLKRFKCDLFLLVKISLICIIDIKFHAKKQIC